ncbi:MAG: hypothetical protein U1F76_22975 [Candidatus Competibacteraceae bacterium]
MTKPTVGLLLLACLALAASAAEAFEVGQKVWINPGIYVGNPRTGGYGETWAEGRVLEAGERMVKVRVDGGDIKNSPQLRLLLSGPEVYLPPEQLADWRVGREGYRDRQRRLWPVLDQMVKGPQHYTTDEVNAATAVAEQYGLKARFIALTSDIIKVFWTPAPSPNPGPRPRVWYYVDRQGIGHFTDHPADALQNGYPIRPFLY